MSTMQVSARDVQSSSAGDVASDDQRVFDLADNGKFTGGSINTGILSNNFLIMTLIIMGGFVIMKSFNKKQK